MPWVKTSEKQPEIPGKTTGWGSIMVITCKAIGERSSPMVYERAVIRGKTVFRWKYYWDRIADEVPEYWQYFPEPMPRPYEEVVAEQIKAYIENPNTEVEIVRSCDTGEWLYAVVVVGSLDFWLDAFPTEAAAREYVQQNKLKLREVQA